MSKLRFISGNGLKIIACLLMLIDHIGVILFPFTPWLRYIGRLAFPIFAFTLAEGCKYTRNKLKHFLLIFIAGVVYQIVFHFFSGGYFYLNILITLSIAILCIYALQFAKTTVFSDKNKWIKTVAFLPFIVLMALSYLLTRKVEIDYGFIGVLMPVSASLLDFRNIDAPKLLKKCDNYLLRLLCMTGIIALYVFTHADRLWACWAFFAIIILLFYNEQKGKLKLKYFFHIFYPTHLVLLEAIAMFLL